MIKNKRIILIFLTVILITVFLLGNSSVFAAQDREIKKIRFGLVENPGTQINNGDGTFSGLTIEYLEHVTEYMGYDLEIVTAEGGTDQQFGEIYGKLLAGEVDLMGDVFFVESLQSQLTYMPSPYYYVATVLKTLKDRVFDFQIDPNSTDQTIFKIAIHSKANTRKAELEEFLSQINVMAEYVFYDNLSDQVKALKRGEADMLLSTSAVFNEELSNFATFSQKPCYFVTNKSSHIVSDFSMAMKKLSDVIPTLTVDLESKYFSQNNSFYLVEDEKEFFKSNSNINVAFKRNAMPYSYMKNGEPAGISIDILKFFGSEVGIDLTFVPYAEERELEKLILEEKVDCVAYSSKEEGLAPNEVYARTLPFVSRPYILVTKAGKFSDELKGVLAVCGDSQISQSGITVTKTEVYKTEEECLQAVLNGNADFAVMGNFVAQFYLNKPKFSKLTMSPVVNQTKSLSFAVPKSEDMTLLHVLNKFVLSSNESQIQAIFYENLANTDRVTLVDVIRTNPFESIIFGLIFFGAIIAFWGFIQKRKISDLKNKEMERKKHVELYNFYDDVFVEYDITTKSLVVIMSGQDSLSKTEIPISQEELLATKNGRDFKNILENDQEGEYEFQTKENNWVKIVTKHVHDKLGNLTFTIAKIVDIDADKKEKEALRLKTTLDPLTSILNVATMNDAVESYLAKPDVTGALVVTDIDYFKTINDTFGHIVGDNVLIEIAKVFQSLTREQDLVARMGGDEFMLLFKGLKDQTHLEEICQRIVTTVSGSKLGEFSVTVSLGAVIVKGKDDFKKMYDLADKSLYEAKSQGRNTFRIGKR